MTNALRMISSPMMLIPAYGRSYPTREELREAWLTGKDFKIYGQGCYCSIRDLKRMQDESSSITIVDPRSGLDLIVG